MPLENLEHAMRVLERRILFGGPRLERPHEVVERRAPAPRGQILCDGTPGPPPPPLRPGRGVLPAPQPPVRPEPGLGELHPAPEKARHGPRVPLTLRRE